MPEIKETYKAMRKVRGKTKYNFQEMEIAFTEVLCFHIWNFLFVLTANVLKISLNCIFYLFIYCRIESNEGFFSMGRDFELIMKIVPNYFNEIIETRRKSAPEALRFHYNKILTDDEYDFVIINNYIYAGNGKDFKENDQKFFGEKF